MPSRNQTVQKMLQFLFSSGMSYQALADATGLSATTILRLDKNKDRTPRTGTYDRILRVYAARREELRVFDSALRELEE